MLDLPSGSMSWIPLNDVLPTGYYTGILDTDRLPALCVPEPSCKLSYNGDGKYPLDLVAATFILLTRWEEWTRPVLDSLGRHHEDATLCAKQGFRDRPVLDEWAMMLRPWLVKSSPGWQPILPDPKIWMSHDIDHLCYYKNMSRVARGFMRGVIKQKSLKEAFRNTIEGIVSLVNPEHDPCFRGIRQLIEMDESLGQCGTFFFMSAKPSQYDDGYEISSILAQKIIRFIKERGHEIGWHPGYIAAEDGDVFAEELENLKRSANISSVGVRHHYLRWSAARSWRSMENSGIQYDSSVAYSECLGFRSSTSRFYPAYDLEGDVPMSLEVRPLVIMDGPLFAKPSTAVGNIRKLMSRCQAVSGCFSILIHNYTFAVNPDAGNIVGSAMRKG